MAKTAPVPDQAGLRRCGEVVRARLAAEPSLYRVPTDIAELFALGDFLSPAECDRFIAMIDAVAEPSKLHESAHIPGFRTSDSGNFDSNDPFVAGVMRRIDDLLGIPGEFGEAIQGQRYLPGQEFKPHNDWFYTDEEYWKIERKRGGQRSWTAMVFLNAVEAGGQTHFVDIGIEIEPKPGALLIWNNALPDGRPNPHVLHAGKPVLTGRKYILTQWYRSRPHR